MIAPGHLYVTMDSEYRLVVDVGPTHSYIFAMLPWRPRKWKVIEYRTYEANGYVEGNIW